MCAHPRAGSAGRLKILDYFNDAGCVQKLPRSCLALQLTCAVTTLTAEEGAAKLLIVRLQQREGHRVVEERLSILLQNMGRDQSQKWHPDTYLSAIVVFLSTDESELDVGFSCVFATRSTEAEVTATSDFFLSVAPCA